MPSCPSCGSDKVIKNGSIHNGKPKFSCKECRRQFVENPSNKIIPKETWNLVDKLLLEKDFISRNFESHRDIRGLDPELYKPKLLPVIE